MNTRQTDIFTPIPPYKRGRLFLILMMGILVLGGISPILAAGALPAVETYPATDNNSIYDIDNIITLSANVSDNGSANIEIWGFVYDSLPHSQPQVADNITGTDYAFFVSTSGNWTAGEYSANITHLNSGTRYFFRAGVRNDDDWAYGEEKCFLTVSEPELEAANVIGDELTRIADLLVNLLAFLVLAFVVGLAYWHRDMLLYVLAGLALLAYGAMQFGDNIYLGLLLIILGIYCFVKAALDRRRA